MRFCTPSIPILLYNHNDVPFVSQFTTFPHTHTEDETEPERERKKNKHTQNEGKKSISFIFQTKLIRTVSLVLVCLCGTEYIDV